VVQSQLDLGADYFLAIDPGTTESAYVLAWGGEGEMTIVPGRFGKVPNAELLALLVKGSQRSGPFATAGHLVIEMIASYGMPVGAEVFETCVWIGRFIQALELPHSFMYRAAVKHHLCKSSKAKDSNIRQALIDRWGGKDIAIGKKKKPGPLYGISSDVWAALAVAVTFAENPASARGP
jgi:hypothetical protein